MTHHQHTFAALDDCDVALIAKGKACQRPRSEHVRMRYDDDAGRWAAVKRR